MKNLSRIVLILIALPILYICTFFPLLFTLKTLEKQTVVILSISVTLLMTGLLWWATSHVPPSFLGKFISMTFIIGGAGFLIGYVGPILFTEGNQGPLLGVFITGPLSLVVGGIFSSIYWKLKFSKE